MGGSSRRWPGERGWNWPGGRAQRFSGRASLSGRSTALPSSSWTRPRTRRPTRTIGAGPRVRVPRHGLGALVNLSHGGWEGFVVAKQTAHDASVAHDLLDLVEEGDLLLADRAYCSYELIALARARGAHVLMRLHQARHRALDWRQGKKIGRNERIVTWRRPSQPKLSGIGTEAWKALPETLTLRLVKMEFEDRYGRKSELVVLATLLDPSTHCGVELSELYARRWVINVRTPEMAHRTLQVVMIAYNLMRALMLEASPEDPHAPGFRAVVDLVTANHGGFQALAEKPRLLAHRRRWLLGEIGARKLHKRPGRSEPRAVKRRLKPYPLLTTHRAKCEEIPHRSRYRNAA